MPVPPKPAPVKFGEIEETEINVEWTPVEGATSYKVIVRDFAADPNDPEADMVFNFDGAFGFGSIAVVLICGEMLELTLPSFGKLF